MQDEQEKGQGGGQPGQVGGGRQEGGEYVCKGVGQGPAEASHCPRPPHWQAVAARGHARLHPPRETTLSYICLEKLKRDNDVSNIFSRLIIKDNFA